MDTPFYRIHRPTYQSSPRYSYSSSASPIPVNHQTTPARKVVSIPVRHVGSERSRSDSAVKIQKVFRGFLVRKSMKKISEIRREVNEMEKRISTKETVELIRKDSKERLKVNEALMSLLFKLDSVLGVDSGVRNCRKAVIKKAIALQEMVDAIVASDQTGSKPDNFDSDSDLPAGDQTGSKPDSVDSDSDLPTGKRDVDQGQNDSDSDLPAGKQDVVHGQTLEMQDTNKSPEVNGSIDNSAHNCNSVDETGDLESEADVAHKAEDNHETVHESQGGVEFAEVVEEDGDDVAAASVSESAESVETSQFESQADSSANPQCLIEGDEDGNGDDGEEDDDDEDDDALGKHENHVEIHRPDEKEGNVDGQLCGGRMEENRKSRELLEKMMVDNEKMMGLVTELFERNERQTRLLSALSQRVEQLEMAFLCERLRRKKKRDAAWLMDCLESTKDTRKCGKKL